MRIRDIPLWIWKLCELGLIVCIGKGIKDTIEKENKKLIRKAKQNQKNSKEENEKLTHY